MAGTGLGLQAGAAGDSETQAASKGRAGRKIRHPGVPRRSAGRRGAAPECAGCAGDGLGEHAEVGDEVKCVLESGWSPGPFAKSDGGHLLLKYWEPLYRLPR